MKIHAIVKSVTNGYEYDKKLLESLSFEVNDMFEVDRIEIGRSSTKVFLTNYKQQFNSVHFDFIDAEDNDIDIFNTTHPLVINNYMYPFPTKNKPLHG